MATKGNMSVHGQRKKPTVTMFVHSIRKEWKSIVVFVIGWNVFLTFVPWPFVQVGIDWLLPEISFTGYALFTNCIFFFGTFAIWYDDVSRLE